MKTTIRRSLIPALLVALALSSACSRKVTIEGSPQGAVAVHATTVVDAVSRVSAAVKQLEASGVVPTAQAAVVVRGARDIDTLAIKLSDLLRQYDAAVKLATTPLSTKADVLDQIQVTLERISVISGTLLVPITSDSARKQIGDLVGALNQSVITTSMTLAKLQAAR